METHVEIPKRFSPSGIGTYLDCQERYRCERVANLPTATTADQTRGLAVHTAAERLMVLPQGTRSRETAVALGEAAWAEMLNDPNYALVVAPDGYQAPEGVVWPSRSSRDPEADPVNIDHGIPVDPDKAAEMLDSIRGRLHAYYDLGANPDEVQPVAIEPHVEAPLGDYAVHGYIDRLDSVQGVKNGVRILDYKSGKAPDKRFAGPKFAQLRLYAYAVAKSTDWVPVKLMLVYLNPQRPGVRVEDVTEETLRKTEVELRSNIDAIVNSYETNTWVANPTVLCNWCEFRFPNGDYPGCEAYAKAVENGAVKVR